MCLRPTIVRRLITLIPMRILYYDLPRSARRHRGEDGMCSLVRRLIILIPVRLLYLPRSARRRRRASYSASSSTTHHTDRLRLLYNFLGAREDGGGRPLLLPRHQCYDYTSYLYEHYTFLGAREDGGGHAMCYGHVQMRTERRGCYVLTIVRRLIMLIPIRILY